MTVLMQDQMQSRQNPHLDVICRCGKKLRARPDQGGTKIVCWSCHAEVLVPVPVASGDWVARLLRMAAKQIFEARTFTMIAIGAVLVTAALGITNLGIYPRLRFPGPVPNPGVWAAAVAMALVMVGYGELIRRGSQGDWTNRPRVGLFERAWRILVCASAGAAMLLPLAIAARAQTHPRVTINGSLVAACVTMLVPILMLGTYGATGSVAARLRSVGSTIARHPVALVASMLMLPLSLVAVEAVLFTFGRIHGSWAFLMLDLFPKLDSVQIIYDIPYIDKTDFRAVADDRLIGIYLEGIRHGHSLGGAIPASLALNMSNNYYPGAIGYSTRGFTYLRLGYTLLIVSFILAFLAIQARWLGLISTVDSRKTLASPVPFMNTSAALSLPSPEPHAS